jgi:hypothetical protein
VVGKGNEEMRTRINRPRTEQAEPIPDVRPWREVGWIFRDGDALAIERQGTRTRVRSAAALHLRDE